MGIGTSWLVVYIGDAPITFSANCFETLRYRHVRAHKWHHDNLRVKSNEAAKIGTNNGVVLMVEKVDALPDLELFGFFIYSKR